jgi:hypothetical protein
MSNHVIGILKTCPPAELKGGTISGTENHALPSPAREEVNVAAQPTAEGEIASPVEATSPTRGACD